MDRLTALQEVIDRTQHVAGHYRQPAGFEIHGADILTYTQRNWALGALHRQLVEIAEDHAGCVEAGCRTCGAVQAGLAVALRQLHGMQVAELEAEAAPRRSWWRRLIWA